MRDGYKIIDMDTHVNPDFQVLEKYVEPSFRPRLEELTPYLRKREAADGGFRTSLSIGPVRFNRFPGEAPDAAG